MNSQLPVSVGQGCYDLQMANQDRAKALRWLLGERYPHNCASRLNPSYLTAPLILPEDEGEWTEETYAARAYFHELEKLSDDELITKAVEEKRLKAEREADEFEQSSRFNRSSAIADDQVCDYWSKAAYWNIDEGCALLLERDPKALNDEAYRQVQYGLDQNKNPQIWRKFEDLRDLAQRAKVMKQISSYNVPGFFIAWAKRNRIEVPEALEAAVRGHGHQIADWKTAYDNAADRLKVAETELANLKAGVGVGNSQNTESLTTRERDSLLKLVIGMAMKGYGHDPKAGRTSTAGEIASDLQIVGLSLDEDTIRKYLNEAKELLPPEMPE